MNKIEEASVQATHIKNALEGVISSLYDMTGEDLRKMNITIATMEAIYCLVENHADNLERLEV